MHRPSRWQVIFDCVSFTAVLFVAWKEHSWFWFLLLYGMWSLRSVSLHIVRDKYWFALTVLHKLKQKGVSLDG